ncbi:uncharacterized protein LOC125261123 isoform X2 [Megalobrama amblycephala]|uniref:uncharacterized protein LOC125261123 isoform X2 n=1 Tax=Megalobrama amblycephala TaxID=75352 RepID=UPI002013CFA3|nr:uncharacterized protein LOC125261123 isoform X2 [Megalobrama amblycephala]
MAAADLLCDSLLRWLENRRECGKKLLELAQELENVTRSSKAVRVAGAAKSVANPPVADQAAGTAVSVTSKLVEAGISRSTFNKATELIKEDEKVGKSIQKQLQDLKDRCGGAKLGAHADELECEVVTQLMWALARRNKTLVPLDFLRGFNRATFFRHMTPGGLDPAKASCLICQALGLARSPEITSSLKVSAKEMMKNTGQIGIKAAVKAGSKVPSAINLSMSLYDLIDQCEELVKRKKVAEASKFLRDSAREIPEGQQKLKEQLDAMHEIIQKLFKMKNLITNLGGYSLSMNENGRNVVAYIRGTCRDSTVVSWLQGVTHQNEFLNLLRFCMEGLSPILNKYDSSHIHIPEHLTRPDGRHIDIVIVAHGRIVDQFMPAGFLVPKPTIRDTILYSPWNCFINSNAVFGIAQGNIQVEDRELCNNVYSEPNPLPNHWNSMQGSRHNIPLILLSPVTPEDEAWKIFQKLWKNRDLNIKDRVIFPYLVPQDQVDAYGEIPLLILISAISVILLAHGRTATVHLAACLGHAGSPAMPEEWRAQYAYTSDQTYMTVNLRDDKRNVNMDLLRALRLLFDSQEP